ncbi:MAG: hypothetical protein ABI746_05845 [Dermatophilaceae bacterium]
MGLGLAFLTAGAFLRFVLGRYQEIHGAYDAWGSLLMLLGVASMAASILRWRLGTPRLVRRDRAGDPSGHAGEGPAGRRH